MVVIKKIAIVGASGNFGRPITTALVQAGFDVTIITRPQSTTSHPTDIRVIRTEYTVAELTGAFVGHDAVVCVVGPGGIKHQVDLIDAAEAAGVYRFIIDDFGWGPEFNGFPEFREIHAHRREGWSHAQARAEVNSQFTWSGLTTGNPIDWAMKRFPLMGFNIPARTALIYDAGTEEFTGTTLQGIGQAVVGVMHNPEATANRFLKVRSIRTSQNKILAAFQRNTEQQWNVQRAESKDLTLSGKQKFQAGRGGWVLELVVAQMFDVGQARCIVAPSRGESDSELLGVKEESEDEIVRRLMA
ncbi:hypothetical protein AUEXF2481DRAFT_45306 [Aureobasidium subglaciale EXF-2481]|uniref:NAD(P)-binding domain-containing protein n=1 Tax=Aureobasidium subglaciale (strain EXF-2481) TaxID=1043005 RepID=A0A074Y2T0_AURSE|nr:uncharacterized protein AUEXF2481DRAFT_45306 [Aureobasidium subglaciale EXF-2481]KEQ90224.1 hypothetical protein AUEXF2481DRAFT_45306 [Aureobasidium subglaciale EXF-2481]